MAEISTEPIVWVCQKIMRRIHSFNDYTCPLVVETGVGTEAGAKRKA